MEQVDSCFLTCYVSVGPLDLITWLDFQSTLKSWGRHIDVLLKPSVKKESHISTKMLFHSRCGTGRQLFLDSWLDILMKLWKIIACACDAGGAW